MRGRIVLVSAAALACLAVLAASTQLPEANPAPVEIAPAYCEKPSGFGVERAGQVAALFVLTTVISDGARSPECSFDYTTAELRQGKDRREWEAHNPVAPFVVDFPEAVESGLKPGTSVAVVRRDGRAVQVSAQLVVGGPYRNEWVQQEFLIRLVFEGEWRVDYWGPLIADVPGFGPARTAE
jgi:hypothetical protein